jgi:hypothetical protein
MEKTNKITIYTLDGKKILEQQFVNDYIEIKLEELSETLYIIVLSHKTTD